MKAGASVNQTQGANTVNGDRKMNTALGNAVLFDNIEMVKYLLAQGSNPNANGDASVHLWI
ncbi:hypothetical protein JKY79_02645 [Candidatus Babeliales bacterium]|nr:hypothetical protein [Candidatus Babeliales bacterium]